MARLAILFLVLALAACDGLAPVQVTAPERPMRIVSLDYCADQYVLELADREQILAVSPHAGADYSYMRAAAEGVPRVRPSAEDVLVLQPDLVVRSYGGGPNAAAFFERAGVPVLQLGWTETVAGDGPGTITATIRHLASGLGQEARGETLVAQFEARLAALQTQGAGQSALYVTPGGVTSGPGSLIHEMLIAAGLANFETAPGWHPIPLEQLAREAPDRFVFASFEGGAGPWSAARHPLLARQLRSSPVTEIEGAWTACGGWFLMDAVEALARGGAAP